MTVLALFLAVTALLVALFALRKAAALARPAVIDDSELPADALALRREVAALQREHAQSLRHLSVVRYDAFEDMGGQLSWSLALLDDDGSGVVVSSIHGRNDARTYAKPVSGWSSESTLSPEETTAITQARPG